MVASMKIAVLVLVIVAVVAAHDSYSNRRCRSPSRGRYASYSLYNNKRSVRYRCRSGYVKLRGYERHACYNGRWYPGTPLVCQKRKRGSTRRCGKPPRLECGEYKTGYYRDGGNRYQYARYTCDRGYYFRSGYQSVRIICKFGKWAPSRPERCYPIAGRTGGLGTPFIPGNPYGSSNINQLGPNNGYPLGPNNYNPYNQNNYNPYNPRYNPNTINQYPYNPNTINPLGPNTLNPYNPNIVNPYNPNTVNPLGTNTINPYNPNNVNRLAPGSPSINRLGVDNPINPINTVNPLSVNLPNQVPINPVHQGHIG